MRFETSSNLDILREGFRYGQREGTLLCTVFGLAFAAGVLGFIVFKDRTKEVCAIDTLPLIHQIDLSTVREESATQARTHTHRTALPGQLPE